MEALKFIIGVQVLLSVVAVFGIIYISVRRVRKSKKERFQKRDN